MKRCLSTLLLAAGFAFTASLHAQDQGQGKTRDQNKISWYQVEVIVFEYTRPQTEGESWYVNPGLPHEENSIALITDAPEAPALNLPATGPGGAAEQAGAKDPQGQDSLLRRIPYLELSPDHDHLDEVYHILKLSGGYRPLYHATWQQPGLADDQARYVHFTAVRDGGAMDNAPQEQDAAPAEEAATSEQAAPGEMVAAPAYQPPAFDAMLRLRASQFLHVDLDIAYFPPDPSVLESANGEAANGEAANGEAANGEAANGEAANGEAANGEAVNGEAANGEAANGEAETGQSPEHADYVRLTESRRVRLKELHYFDHPLFGVIVQVTRLEDKDSK
jgi:hypothetical protein